LARHRRGRDPTAVEHAVDLSAKTKVCSVVWCGVVWCGVVWCVGCLDTDSQTDMHTIINNPARGQCPPPTGWGTPVHIELSNVPSRGVRVSFMHVCEYVCLCV
jgi:hypothetical protein